jgi:hypothetical protein
VQLFRRPAGAQSPIAMATRSTISVCVASKKRIGFGRGSQHGIALAAVRA